MTICFSFITVICLIVNISFVNSAENMSFILSHGVVPDVVDVSPTEAVHVSFLVGCNLPILFIFLQDVIKNHNNSGFL
jgi:hypothetical protein